MVVVPGAKKRDPEKRNRFHVAEAQSERPASPGDEQLQGELSAGGMMHLTADVLGLCL